MTTERPRFHCGYNGETEYMWNGRKYACRYREAMGLVPECNGYRELVGTVHCVTNNKEFPPAELMAHFPGYVAARYAPTGETYTIELRSGAITVARCVWEFDGIQQVEESSMGLVSAQRARELENLYAVA